jgi:RNA polymerase sigma-70 factor, ECF subfamily
MTGEDEKRLVKEARSGDQRAFAGLFRQSRPQIKDVGREVFNGPGSESDLEDFCSDVYLLGLRYLNSFRGECRFSTWIVQIARHKAIATLQRRGQPKNGDAQLVYQGNGTSDEWESECSPREDRHLEAVGARSDVADLMQILRPGQRQLVQFYHLDGFTETEIASRTGLSVYAVRGRLWRAMVQLRKKVEKDANRNGTEISLTK